MTKEPFDTSFLPIVPKHTIGSAWKTGDIKCLLLSDGRRLSGQVFYDEMKSKDATDRLRFFVQYVLYPEKLNARGRGTSFHLIFEDQFAVLRPWVNHVGWMTNEITRLARLIAWCSNTNEVMLEQPPIMTLKHPEINRNDGLKHELSRAITPTGLALLLQAAGFFEAEAHPTHAGFMTLDYNKLIGVPYWRYDTKRHEDVVDEILGILADRLGDQQVYLQKLAYDLDCVQIL
jgi:hypothetical protein